LKKNKIITYIIGLISFLIPVKLFLTPPTDSDGGPMMAYNFLFFYPLVFLSVILSIIVIFRLKYFGKEFLPKIPLFISVLPSSILTIMVLINFVRISTEPEILDLEIHNNTINLNVNDSLEIKLHGFTKRTMGKNDEIIEVKIVNLIPYVNGKYSFKDGGKFISKNNNQEIFYKIKNDSLVIYNYGYEYDFYNKTRIPLPFKIQNFETQKIKKEQPKRLGIEKFNWK
jgi:hypothetical protein